MVKITFIGAGSTVFVKNVIGDCLLCDAMHQAEIALYDIDSERLAESEELILALNKSINQNGATIKTYCGLQNRRAALAGADFVINAVQVGLYSPCTVIDFEIPKKYGLRQTIGDTLGIGGIFRALRTIPVLRGIAEDMSAVCPNAWFLNYTNPMAMLTGFMQRYTDIKAIGLCHSVQTCADTVLRECGIEVTGHKELIAGINHMAWLLTLEDLNGNDLYPEVRRIAAEKNLSPEGHRDMVRFDYILRFGYYCTESSEHNAEYNPFYIKSNYPELIEKYHIPLDEYPRRCVNQIERWKAQKDEILNGGNIEHSRSIEYASHILEAIITNTPYRIGGNVINHGLISNLVKDACVEVPCLVDGTGISPIYVGALPPQCAAMNMTNINVQLLTIEAAVTGKKELVYNAAMLDPHTASELSIDDIVSMCDELLETHKAAGYPCLGANLMF